MDNSFVEIDEKLQELFDLGDLGGDYGKYYWKWWNILKQALNTEIPTLERFRKYLLCVLALGEQFPMVDLTEISQLFVKELQKGNHFASFLLLSLSVKSRLNDPSKRKENYETIKTLLSEAVKMTDYFAFLADENIPFESLLIYLLDLQAHLFEVDMHHPNLVQLDKQADRILKLNPAHISGLCMKAKVAYFREQDEEVVKLFKQVEAILFDGHPEKTNAMYNGFWSEIAYRAKANNPFTLGEFKERIKFIEEHEKLHAFQGPSRAYGKSFIFQLLQQFAGMPDSSPIVLAGSKTSLAQSEPVEFIHPDDMETCFNCHAKPGKLSACSGCKKVRYCNKECQSKDWPKHKFVCKTLAKK